MTSPETSSAQSANIPTFSLRGGAKIPLLGLGTWELSGDEGYDAVRDALDIGYRHIDTATNYKNESVLGRALKHSGVEREDLFLTSKLPGNTTERVREVLEQSLTSLETDYLDLWLLHWSPLEKEDAQRVWDEMISAQTEGLVKSIGVSNHDEEQLDALIDATAVTPALNQIPWSPSQHDPQKLVEHTQRGIVVSGYSPFKGANLDATALQEVAQRHDVSPQQVIVRWHIDRGVVVIPKSSNPTRLAANMSAVSLTLSDDDLALIDGLAQ